MNSTDQIRRPLWFRLLRGFLFLGIALVTLGALVWAFENWRGERAWQAMLRAYAAKGDPLDQPPFTPLTVPDEQNVVMTPLLRPLREYDLVKGEHVWRDSNAIARLDALALPKLSEERTANGRTSLTNWQATLRSAGGFPMPEAAGKPATDVLAALARWKPELDELEAATRRPYARFNFYVPGEIHALLPQLSRGKALSTILQLRCAARLAAGDSAGALADIEFNERWAKALGAEPLLISQLVVIAIETIGTRMAWEGLVDHRWNDAQLRQLQKMFADRRPREALALALKGERAFALSMMDLWVRDPQRIASSDSAIPTPRLPRGWVRQNQISLVRYHELLAESADQWIQGKLPGNNVGTDPIEQLKRERPKIYSQLTLMLAPAFVKSMSKADRLLAISRMAEIACALERYRLAQGKYPDALSELTPALIAALPADPCTGEAFRYAKFNDGYRLYSLGLNGRDDQGVFIPDDDRNDWLWPLPIPTEKRMF